MHALLATNTAVFRCISWFYKPEIGHKSEVLNLDVNSLRQGET